MGPALLVAAICSLGATIAGPAVLSIEYEPTPRAFAVPLSICAVGLAAHRRYLGAGIAPLAPFCTIRPRRFRSWRVPCARNLAPALWGFAPMLAAAILLIAARGQRRRSSRISRRFRNNSSGCARHTSGFPPGRPR